MLPSEDLLDMLVTLFTKKHVRVWYNSLRASACCVPKVFSVDNPLHSAQYHKDRILQMKKNNETCYI
jgi:hypothetical protein